MSDNSLQSVIEKVNKLRALAEGNTNLHEQEAARAAADRLIQEYRISQAELESAQGASENDDPMVRRTIHDGGRRTNWRETILRALSAHYGIAWYMNHSRRNVWDNARGRYKQERTMSYVIVGRESDCEIAHYMFSWITAELERLSRWHNGGNGVGAAKSWFDGAAVGVSRQFSDLGAAMRAKLAGSAAMVLFDREKAAEAYMNAQTAFPTYKRGAKKGQQKGAVGIGGARSDMDAFEHGYEVGKNLKIQQGLPAGKETKPNQLS